MSQIRIPTRSSRVGTPYWDGFRAKSRGPGLVLMVETLMSECGIAATSSQQSPGVGEHDLVELRAVERRLEQPQERALAREEGRVRAEQKPIYGHCSAVGRMRVGDQPNDPAVALDGR